MRRSLGRIVVPRAVISSVEPLWLRKPVAHPSFPITRCFSTDVEPVEAPKAPSYTVEDIGGDDGVDVDGRGLRRAWYRRKRVRGSVKKLLPLARQVKGLSAVEAMAQMTFSGKQRAEEMRYCIYRAATKAEFYYEMDPTDLLVEEVLLEKGPMRRFHMRYHSRGRFGINKIWDTKIKVVVREMTPEEREKLVRFPVGQTRTPKKDLDPRWY